MFKNKKKAVTLIELLVALGILGLTLALGAMFLKFQIPGLALASEAQTVRSELLRARSLTLTQQTPHGLVLEPETGAYRLDRLGPSPATLANFTLGSGITFGAAGPFLNNTVTFNPAGAAAESGTIILRNSNNVTKTITISPSGFVTVE